jgi:hypothetical protein
VTAIDFLSEVVERVHRNKPASPVIGRNGQAAASPFDVLWTRKSVAGSPIEKYVSTLIRNSYDNASAHWLFDPASARRTLRENPTIFGARFEAWNRGCSETTENACTLLDEIVSVRSGGRGGEAQLVPVEVGDDSAGARRIHIPDIS